MITLRSNILSLIGMTGCGKSSVGRQLARRLGARFVDLDAEIVSRHGDIRGLFETGGEEGFRKAEYETLRTVLEELKADDTLTILSCGGGLPTYAPSRILLKRETTVLWLKRSLSGIRPTDAMLQRPPVNGSLERYRELLSERCPVYRKCADYSFFNAFPQRTAAMLASRIEISQPNRTEPSDPIKP